MNNQGNSVVETFIALIVVLFVGSWIISMFAGLSCVTEKNQIAGLNSTLVQKNSEIRDANQRADFYKNQYETLRDYNITKQDFVDLKAQINELNYQYTQINQNIYSINQVLNNTVNAYNVSYAINLALFPISFLTLFDIAFLNFKYTSKARRFLVNFYIKAKTYLPVKK